MSEHTLAILVKAIGAAKAAKELKGVDRAVSDIGARTGKGIRTSGTNLSRLGVVAGGVVVGGLAAAAKAAIDWQDAFQGVVKTVDEKDLKSAGLTFDGLGDSIREMSREMPNSAIELAGIAASAGALGIKAKDIEGFTKQVAILASTTNVTAEDAATALGQMGTIIGLTGDEFDNFAAALVDLGNKGSSTEAQILEIARRSGGAAKLMHIAKNATLGWAAAAANLGLNEELAGTALQTFFVKTRVAIAKNGSALKNIAKISGTTAAKFKQAFKKDASGALETFIKGLSKLSEGKRIIAIQQLFGKTSGLTRLLVGLAGDTKNLTDSVDTSTTAWKNASAAQAEFDKRNSTIKSTFARLKNNIIDSAVLLGEGFAPALGRAAEKLTAFLKVPENRAAIKKLGEDIGKLLDGIDWNALLQNVKGLAAGFEKAGGMVKTLWDGFNAMPAEAKGLLIALVGLNKLSGGAVAGVVGELGKGLIKGVLGMNAGVVNIKAGVVNGAGGGAAGAAGAAGGGMSKAAKFAAGASIIADVAAVAATYFAVNQESSDHATAVHETQSVFLKNSPTTDQIKTALAGVDKGIADITSNPLLTIVQGDALTQLQAMRAELVAALKTPAKGTEDHAGKSKDDLVKQTKKGTVAAIKAAARVAKTVAKVQHSVDAEKRATVNAAHRTAAAVRRTTSAIKDKDLSVSVKNTTKTTVRVAVTAAGVKRSITHLSRATKSGGTYTSGGYD